MAANNNTAVNTTTNTNRSANSTAASPAANRSANNSANNRAASNASNNRAANNKASNNRAANNRAANNRAANNRAANNRAANNAGNNNAGNNAGNNNAGNNKAANNKAANNAGNNAGNNKAANNAGNNKAANNAGNNKAANNKTNTLKSQTNSLKNAFSSFKDKMNDPKNKKVKQVVIFVVVLLVTLLVCFLVRKLIMGIRDRMNSKPWLVKGSKNAKKSLVIAQNPKDENSVTLYRSDDKDGLEFGYGFWMCIQDMQYNYGKWKHVFHKGNKSAYPNRSPGVWIHPENNALRIYMNTYKEILNYVDVENIPVQKWIHIGIVVSGTNMDVYVNGKLRKRTQFDSVPKQNFGDVWVTMNGGFEGYMSRLQYFRYAVDYKEMESIVKQGPSKDACGDTGELPPYLDDDWWFDV